MGLTRRSTNRGRGPRRSKRAWDCRPSLSRATSARTDWRMRWTRWSRQRPCSASARISYFCLSAGARTGLAWKPWWLRLRDWREVPLTGNGWRQRLAPLRPCIRGMRWRHRCWAYWSHDAEALAESFSRATATLALRNGSYVSHALWHVRKMRATGDEALLRSD